MIKKFQLGGQQLQLLDQIFAMINLLPEEALKQLVQSGAKPEDIAKIVQVGVQLGKINPEVGKAVMQALQGQVSAARHGMKLQYIKSLKHQCADDEELYYYKKGGSVGCGCKKKEEGGEVEKAKKGCKAVENFKAMKMQKAGKIKTKAEQNKINKQSEEDYFNGTADHTKPGESQKSVQKFKTRTKAELDRIDRLSERDYFNGTSDHTKPGTRREEPFEPNPRPRPRSKSTTTIKRDTSRSIKTQLQKTGGSVVEKFKSAKCGSKMKKHKLGGSLNGIPFYLEGTNKGGITEKSDNTRVQRIPNNGEGVYEQIPVNGWNFVPVVGTLKEAKMLDQGDPNASVTRLGISLAGDLVGAGMIGSVAKAAGKVGRIQKALKARGYQLFTKDGSLWFRLPKKIIRGYGDKLYTYEIPNIYGGSSFKTIPTVDYAPAVMTPLVLTLRVPAEAPFFNYSK